MMNKHFFNLIAASLLATGSSLAWGQTAFDVIVQQAESQLKQYAQSGKCQGGNCSSTSTESTNCSGGSCADASSADAASSTESGTAVADVLKDINFVSGKPNLKAEYYIYLYSASWCPPCRKLMPDIVKEYANIKKSGKVELILVGADQNEKKVKEYVDKYKATFPATWQGSKGVMNLPGNKPPRGIPGAIIVDKAGNTITSGHGSLVLDWKKHTIDKK